MGVLMELRAAANFWVRMPLLGGWQGPLLAPGATRTAGSGVWDRADVVGVPGSIPFLRQLCNEAADLRGGSNV